jgi:uncharacterized delta-60 repeat protein
LRAGSDGFFIVKQTASLNRRPTMWFPYWLRRALTGSTRVTALPLNRQGKSRARARNHNFRPQLEPLERRDLPTAGFLDQSFGVHGKVDQLVLVNGGMVVSDVAVQKDGKIVVAGIEEGDLSLMRFNSDGTLDKSFGQHGLAHTGSGNAMAASGLVIQPDGNIVVAGTRSPANTTAAFMVVRYTSSGALDPSFDSGTSFVTTDFHDIGAGNARANSVALQPDGKIVVAGSFMEGQSSYFALARYTPGGSADNTFGSGGSGEVLTDFNPGATNDSAFASAVAVQADGRIVAAGEVLTPGPQGGYEFALARYYADGSPDSDFNGNGQVTTPAFQYQGADNANGLAIQADGKLLVVGESGTTTGGDIALLRRYNPDGSLDQQYGLFGLGALQTVANKVAVQADGRIIVAGDAFGFGVLENYLLARFTPGLTPDTSFSYDGLVETNFVGITSFVAGLAIQPDGKIIAAGNADGALGIDVLLARYNGNAGVFQFSAASYSALEGDASVALTVTRSDGSSGAVTVDYATSDGTASAGADYVAAQGTIAFADGETSKTFTIGLHEGGGVDGPPPCRCGCGCGGTEDFQVSLSNPTGGAVLAASMSGTAVSGTGVSQSAVENLNIAAPSACSTANAPPTTATVVLSAGPVTHFGLTALATVATGTPFSITVTALDAANNVVTGYQGTVRLGTLTDPLASPTPAHQFTNGVGGDNGVHTFTGLVLQTAGSQSWTAFDSSNPPVILTGNTNVLALGLAGSNLSITCSEGVTFSGVVATFADADPHGFAGEYVANIDWGDGTSATPGIITANGLGFDVSGTHTYAEEGTRSLKVIIQDLGEEQIATQGLSTVSVTDAALSATPVAGLNVKGGVSATLTLAKFSDADPAGLAADYTVTVSWGDNSSNTSNDGTGTVVVSGNGPFTVMGTHTYAPFPKKHPLTITVTINDNGSSTMFTEQVTDPPAHTPKHPRPPAHAHPHHGATAKNAGSEESLSIPSGDDDDMTAMYDELLKRPDSRWRRRLHERQDFKKLLTELEAAKKN